MERYTWWGRIRRVTKNLVVLWRRSSLWRRVLYAINARAVVGWFQFSNEDIRQLLIISPILGKYVFWWCLTPLSTISQYIVAVRYIVGGNRSTWRKPPTCRVTDKLYHIMVYTSPWYEIWSHNMSSDMHWLHSSLLVQLSYDRGTGNMIIPPTEWLAAFLDLSFITWPLLNIIRVIENDLYSCQYVYLMLWKIMPLQRSYEE